MNEELNERLEREPVRVECSICRHRQRLSTAAGRCDQCSSEIRLWTSHEEARTDMQRLNDGGRIAFLKEIDRSLYAVIANRDFPPTDR